MSEKVIEQFECDEIMNNPTLMSKEYSITVNEVTRKIYIASDLNGSEVILQGILGPCIIQKAENVAENYGRNATFSGNIIVKNWPIDIVDAHITKAETPAPEPATPALPAVVKPEEKKSAPSAQPKAKTEEQIAELVPGDLLTTRPKVLAAPADLSRTERARWWELVRKAYPEGFNSHGNWIGLPEKEKKDEQPADVKTEHKAESSLGKMSQTGKGNFITNMADAKVRNGFFIGYFADTKKKYGIVAAPAENFDKAPVIIVNKEKTGNHMLAAMKTSPSFAKKVEGCSVFPTSRLTENMFTKDTPVYFVTEVVNAMKAIDGQRRTVAEEKK